MLKLRLLGEIELIRDGERLALPPSRKTRALLAYLAAIDRPQRRERLCTMFWDLPDDPRAALRWSLSRLRALVDEPERARIVANRETVGFEALDAEIDLVLLRRAVAGGVESLSTPVLEQAAARFAGEFLEGLDLPSQHDFQAWCVAERETLRRLQIALLTALVGRHPNDPAAALPPARRLVQADPLNETARTAFLRLLLQTGRRQEAESHFEAAERLFRELGPDAAQRLAAAWQALRRLGAGWREAAPEPLPAPSPPPVAARDTMVGRAGHLARLRAAAGQAVAGRQLRVLVLAGEPGVGKSRLAGLFASEMRERGLAVFAGSAYDTKLRTAYGPWIEALGDLPTPDEAGPPAAGRDRLFAAVAARIATEARGALLVLDDVQWIDEASADLLHHVVRAGRQLPLVVVLTLRDGELPDNPHLASVLRSIRRDGLVEDLRLEPLSADETRRLLGDIADPDHLEEAVRLSGGNPLYAVELARGLAERAGVLPATLRELIRDRIERLDPNAGELLRWASVIGPVVDTDRLAAAAGLDDAVFLGSIELVERHRLLVPSESEAGAYAFSHELVRQAVLAGLSEPRRRLMHLKIARLLQARSHGDAHALEIASHAAAGGDAHLAASACVAAGRHNLRLFARAEALTLVRHGRLYAERLPEPARSERLIELLEIEVGVDRPADRADLIRRIEALAGAALDQDRPEYARRCYTMLSHLRWETGEWGEARRDTLRAELVSRATDDRERVVAMGEASRCLAMLERDLGTAESLATEADALAKRLQIEPNALADAAGLLCRHRGERDEAALLFDRARTLARREGDRVAEFLALEHQLVLEIERGAHERASALCEEAVVLTERIRSGSERPFAAALRALCRHIEGHDPDLAAFEAALAALRLADAKHRLAFVATTAARLLRARGERRRARLLAEEALAAATLLDRRSDVTMALAVLAEIAFDDGDAGAADIHLRRLGEIMMTGVSESAFRAAEDALSRHAAA